MVISVASGKGGTGKTIVAVSLALAAAPVTLVDADVEEPNANILLKAQKFSTKSIFLPFPTVKISRCDFCEKCSDFCPYNAIVVLRGLKVFAVPEICKSCGGCAIVCPQNAISEENRKIGYIHTGERNGVHLIEGELLVGETSPTPLIRKLLNNLPDMTDTIIDAPPGAAHPMVESIKPADLVLLVTEPTPFGLHDLKEAVSATRTAGKKRVAIVINRSDVGDDNIKKFASKNGIPILLEIPYDTTIAQNYSRGYCLSEAFPEWHKKFINLWQKIKKIAK